ADDLHVVVGVRREPRARVHDVLVDHPQVPEAHERGVVVVAEAEGVAGVEPAEAGAAAVLGPPDLHLHASSEGSPRRYAQIRPAAARRGSRGVTPRSDQRARAGRNARLRPLRHWQSSARGPSGVRRMRRCVNARFTDSLRSATQVPVLKYQPPSSWRSAVASWAWPNTTMGA